MLIDPKQLLVEALESELLNEEDATNYYIIVGALIYLMIYMCPNIAFPISHLLKFVVKPGLKHIVVLKCLFCYLRGSTDIGIAFSVLNILNPQLIGYSNSDFVANLNNRQSISGFVFLLNGGSILWKFKQQSLVTFSTHNAKYVSLVIALYEVIWL